MAHAIVENIPQDAMETSIERVELSKIGKGPDDKSGFFLNIYLKQEFVTQRINAVNREKVLKL